uniref:Uncharacterized protein n=1 Tax=Peronospora matthiolae TaxID=2874970 RepID=A0AAV1T8R0_9STRA
MNCVYSSGRPVTAQSNETPLVAKEMLRREYDTRKKRDKKETALRLMLSAMYLDAVKVNEDTVEKKKNEIATNFLQKDRPMQVFKARALDVDGTDTKKISQCRYVKPLRPGDEFVYSAFSNKTTEVRLGCWILNQVVI